MPLPGGSPCFVAGSALPVAFLQWSAGENIDTVDVRGPLAGFCVR